MKRTLLLKTLFALLAALCLIMFAVPAGATHTNIRVAVECNLPPYQFVDADGNVAGMHIDIMDAVAKSGDMTVEYIVFDKTTDAVAALRAGEVDAVLGALEQDLTASDLRLSEIISSASMSLIADNRFLDRVIDPPAGSPLYTAAIEFGTISLSQLSGLHTMHTVIMGSQQQLFDALINGDINAIIAVKESVLYQFSHGDAEVEKNYTVVNNYMGTVNYRILTRSSDRVLLNSFDRSIAALRTSGRYEEILLKWLPDADLAAAQIRIEKLLLYIALIIGVALLGFMLIYYWNRQLKRTVEEKTGEIQLQLQRLADEGALRNMLIEHSPNSIVLLRPDGTVLSMNPRARAVTKTVFTDEPAMNMGELPVLGELWELTRERFEQESMQSSAVVSLNIGGNVKKLYRYQYYNLNAGGDKVLLLEDVTREERERSETFEANKNQTLNRIIAGIAHEIKNPLMSIRAFASLIREQGGEADFQASFAQYVPAEVDRINRLVESLINYARPVSGLKEHVLVSKLVEECAYLTYAYAKNKNIRVSSNVDTDAYILVNRDQIKQALINLFINGIESVQAKLAGMQSEPERDLEVRATACRRDNGRVCLEIYDEGLGMSEEEIKNCVEPFYTTKTAGTGMGLSLAKQFIHENDGEFEIDSKQGEFTVMRMVFREDVEN